MPWPQIDACQPCKGVLYDKWGIIQQAGYLNTGYEKKSYCLVKNDSKNWIETNYIDIY
jgi:hypothetical protein